MGRRNGIVGAVVLGAIGVGLCFGAWTLRRADAADERAYAEELRDADASSRLPIHVPSSIGTLPSGTRVVLIGRVVAPDTTAANDLLPGSLRTLADPAGLNAGEARTVPFFVEDERGVRVRITNAGYRAIAYASPSEVEAHVERVGIHAGDEVAVVANVADPVGGDPAIPGVVATSVSRPASLLVDDAKRPTPIPPFVHSLGYALAPRLVVVGGLFLLAAIGWFAVRRRSPIAAVEGRASIVAGDRIV